MKINRAFREILHAFLELLMERNYEDISILSIVNRSSYSRSSFYSYFSSKEELLHTLVNYYAREYALQLIEHMKHFDEGIDSIHDFSRSVLQHVFTNRSFYRLLIEHKLPGYDVNYFCNSTEKVFREQTDYSFSYDRNKMDEDFYYFIATRHFFDYILYWHKHAFAIEPEQLAATISYFIQRGNNKSILDETC